jgi:hypothetical protein
MLYIVQMSMTAKEGAEETLSEVDKCKKNKTELSRDEEGRLRICGQLASPMFGEKGVLRYLFSRLYQEHNKYNVASITINKLAEGI